MGRIFQELEDDTLVLLHREPHHEVFQYPFARAVLLEFPAASLGYDSIAELQSHANILQKHLNPPGSSSLVQERW